MNNIIINRLDYGENSIRGEFVVNDASICDTLENKEKAIPPGIYKLKLRDYGHTYQKYCKRFNENHPVLEIANVENRTDILVHIANFFYQLEGCIATGMSSKKIDGDYILIDSEKAYLKVYYPIVAKLKMGEEVNLSIREIVSQKSSPKYRKPTNEEIMPMPKKEPIELPELPVYKKNGFKTKLGAIALIAGGIMTFIPATSAIGQGLVILGGSVGVVGVGHRVIKSKKNIKEENQYDWLLKLVKLIINYLKKGK